MVLGFIARRTGEGSPVYQRDIEERFHIRRSSVTALLKAMEQDGFITRTAVKQDARLKSLALTDKGRACNQALADCITAFEANLGRGIPPPQLEQLHAMLDRLLQNANDICAGRHEKP